MKLTHWGLVLAVTTVTLSVSVAARSDTEVFAASNQTTHSNTDTFSIGPCQDPQIAIAERNNDAHAYRDTTGKIKQAADYLATKYREPFVNRASVCKHAPGFVYLIPNKMNGEFRKVLRTFARQPAPPKTQTTRPPSVTQSAELSASGCPYPPDIAPSRMSPMIPLSARVNSAEAVFKQRVRLCQQGQDSLVRGGCASVCYGSQTTTQPGDKSISRTPLQTQSGPPGAVTTFDKAIDACFTKFMPDYRSPDWQDFPPEALEPQPDDPIRQSFFIAHVGAESALKTDEAQNGTWDDRELMLDYLIGWLTHCLADQHVLPKSDPRATYRSYSASQLKAATPERMEEHNSWFATGYHSYPLPPFWDRKR